MLEVKAWMVVRDDNPVAVRFTEERANACKTLEERTYHYNEVKVIPVTITMRENDGREVDND